MIVLRPFTESDMPLFTKWLAIPHVAKWYHDSEDWIQEVEQRDSNFRWIHHFIVEADGKEIGFCQFYACCDSDECWPGHENEKGLYSIDYLIGETEYLQRGYGKQIVQALKAKIAEFPEATGIVVQPEPENLISRGLLRSCGFAYEENTDLFISRRNLKDEIC